MRQRPDCTILLGDLQKLGTQKGSGPDRPKEHCRARMRAKNRGWLKPFLSKLIFAFAGQELCGFGIFFQ